MSRTSSYLPILSSLTYSRLVYIYFFYNKSRCFPLFSFPSPSISLLYSAIISPTSVYKDESLTKRVGFYTRVATYVSATAQTVFTGAIVFDEGSNAGSEIASTGFGTFIDVFSESGLGFAITGGVGHFVGVAGDIAQRRDRTGAAGSFTINCL